MNEFVIRFNLFNGLHYVEDEIGKMTLYAVEDSNLKLTDTGLWIGNLKDLQSDDSTDNQSESDTTDAVSDTVSDPEPESDEGIEYPEYGIQSFGGPNPNRAGSIYTVVLYNENAVFYAIDDQDNVTRWPDKDQLKKKDYGKTFTIMEEKTVDSQVYGHGYAGWWIKIPPDKSAPVTPETMVALQGYDDWTVNKFNSTTSIKTNPAVVQHIYTMATHRIIARTANGVSEHTDVPKNKNDVLIELNWLYRNGMQTPITYHLRKNELMMFTTFFNHQPQAYDLSSDIFSELTNRHESCETLERAPSSNIRCDALFVIDDITYTDNQIGKFPIVDIQLRCFWTNGRIGKFGKLLY